MKNIILAAFAALALAAAPARAGSQPQGYLDECYGKPLAVHVTGWAFDPDVSSQSIGIQVYLYTDSGCTTLYDNPTLTANVLRSDVNQAKGITGNHGFNADVPVAAAGDYWVKVFAIDATGDGNVQVGTTRSVTVMPGLPGSGTDADPYRISSVADWDVFAANVGAGFGSDSRYRLEADIGPVTNMVGDSGHSFRGTFNGNGHTLTAAIESAGAWAAPFCYINGATISNLTVTGSVTGGGDHAAGLVGACGPSNPNVIRDCTVAVNVVAAGTGYAGGIVGQGGDSTLSFEDCVFSGSVSGFSAFAGGLLGWGNTMTLNIANCLSTGAFTPSGAGKSHPIACKFANRTVTATVNNAYWINTLVPTVPGGNLIPGAEGTPVSETLVPGTWAQPVTAPDGQTYYRWTTAPAGRLLARYSFDDSGNAGTNLLRAAVGMDAIVRATQTTPIAGPGAIAAVTDSTILSGLAYADGAVAIPNGQHLAVPIPAPLLVGSGRPYTVVMKIRVPDNTGWRSLINMPASNDTDAMVYLHQTTRNIYLKQFDKSSGAGVAASNGNVAADQWTTLTFAFGENATDVYRDGTHVLHATGALAGSYADCAASGGYILVGADDSYDDDLFYLSDFRIYEGAVAAAGILSGSGTAADPYRISSLDDWSLFAANVNAGVDAAACYRLVSNIGSNPNRGTGSTAVTEPVGTSEHPFSGVFLGNGRRITAMINDNTPGAALFRHIDGATIRDLEVKGEYYGGNHVAGIVGFCGSVSPNVISNCVFSGTIFANDGYVGGLVGHGGSGTLVIDHCYVKANLNGFTAHAGGILGWCEDLSLTMRDCLFYGDFYPYQSAVFHPIACKWRTSTPNATVVRTYYINSATPTESGDYLVPGAEGIPVSRTYDPEHDWIWPITAVNGMRYYRWAPDITISSAAEWDAFARGVNEDGDWYADRTVTLAADIAVSTMVGTPENPFDGTFDGAGHTIEVNLSDASAAYTAPFRSIDGATIRNITVAGSVSGGAVAAGLVGRCGNGGPSVISNCTVAASVSASDRAGGIVGEAGGTLTLADCVFSGTISGSFAHAGGLVGWCLAPSMTVRNSLFKGVFSPGNAGVFHPVACKDASASVSAAVDKTYYLFSAAPTETGGFLVPGADGTPVSATFAVGEWEQAVTAADGIVYYKEQTVVTLTSATGLVILQDGDILTGTGGENTHVIVVSGAAVTIRDADVTQCLDSAACEWAGISCEGNVAIILEGTNTLKGGKNYYPGVYVPQGSTLVIRGDGKLTASSNGMAAGIGGGIDGCGNIRIEGGIIDATGGWSCAGIGVGNNHPCGDITIVGGTVSATGGHNAPGIGCGEGSCGAITISGGTVIATGIGSGLHGSCGNIVIEGGSVTSTGSNYMAGIGSGDQGSCGKITISGGNVTATGGLYAAGIGCGYSASCGDISIGIGVVRVVASHGGDATNPIGATDGGTCGTVTVASRLLDVTEGDTRTITANSDPHGKVRLWADGPFWTEINVGAEEPWESGYYFWWGDTVGYKRVNDAWVASDGSSVDFVDTPTYGKDYATLLSNEWITAEGVLAPAHDAAQAHWGGSWRMPTYQELFNLSYNCDWTWTTTNGVNGYVVRGRGKFAAKSIFLPAAGYSDGYFLNLAGSYGYYWSSTPLDSGADYSRNLRFASGDCGMYNEGRNYWRSVRPVWTTPMEITISTAEEWNAFVRCVNEDGESFAGRTVTLAADISVTNAVGTAEYPFDGIFDGAGHTLTVAINGATPCAAPFAVVRGATIKDLTVSGTVSGTPRAAGLVGLCDGQAPTVLLNCTVEAEIGGFSGFAGGLVGWCGADGSPLAITNCFFTGSFTPAAGGVWHPVVCKDAAATIAASVQGAYYLNTLVPTVPDSNVISGAEGSPLNDTFVAGDWARPVTAPDGTVYYLATPRAITISTTEEWNAFARSVNDDGERYANRTVTLAADISIREMVGTADHPFDGTFDGAGHTLDVYFNGWGDLAPFRCISGATITRVKTTGTIYNSAWVAGGIVGGAADGSTNLILNCWSDVKMARHIVWIGGDKVGCGGIIGKGRTSSTTVRNCLFTGMVVTASSGDGDHDWAYAPSDEIGVVGLIYGWGEAGGAHRVENCLASGAIVTWSGFRYSGRTEMLACADGAGTLSNSYHSMVLGFDPMCITQGVDVASMPAADLAAALGDGWHLSDKAVLPVGLEAVGGLDLGTCFGGTRPFDLTEGIVLYLVPSLTYHGRAPDRSSWYSIVDPRGTEHLFPTNLVTPGGVSLAIGKDYRIAISSAIGGTRGTEVVYRPGVGLYLPSSEYLPGNAYEETVTLVGAGANTGTLKLGTFMAGYVPDEDKVEISSPAMFRAFAGWVNYGYSVNAVLTADLAFDPDDLIYDTDGDGVPDANFRPIGTAEHPFGATFDGAGHKITGLRCRGGAAAGLFAYNQGTVAGVVLEDAVLSATNAVGGIAAVNNGTVERCVVANADLSVSSGGAVGAIVGTDNGTLARNFYDGCSVASTATPSGIGTAAGDVDGAHPGIRVCGAGNVNVAGVHSSSSCGAGGNNRVYGGAGESLVVTLDTPDERSDTYTATGGTIAYSGIDVRVGAPYRYTVSIPADAALGHVVTVNRENLWGVNEGCDGTAEHPYVIRSPAGLNLLADVVNNDPSPPPPVYDTIPGNSFYYDFKRPHMTGVFFELGADIVYPHETAWDDATSTENNYTPIGIHEDCPFSGHFDGQGHTICGIRIYNQDVDEVQKHCGIFGTIILGEVKNVAVADTRVTYHREAGGVVGRASDRSVIVDCHVQGDVCVNGFAGSSCHGGIAGLAMKSSTISHCTSAVKITQGGDGLHWGALGGIAGYIADGCTISHCLVVGAVIPATQYNFQGAVTDSESGSGSRDENRLDHNYYADCTVAGETVNVGRCISTGKQLNSYGDLNDADNPDGAVPAIILRDGGANAGALAGSVGQTTNVALYALATAKDGEWNTLCLPFAVGDRAGTPLQGFAVKEFASATAVGGTLQLTFTDAPTGIVAGRPCAVKKDERKIVADAVNVGYDFIKREGACREGGRVNRDHDRLVDGLTNTMWCADMGEYYEDKNTWYDEKYRKHYNTACEFAAVRAVNVTGYTLVTGYDTYEDPMRNPVNWTLKAKRNLSDAWTVLDSRDVTAVPADALPEANCAEKSYGIAAGLQGEYRYFRFEMNDWLAGYSSKWEGEPAAANWRRQYVQLSEFRLQGTYEADAPLGAAAFAGVTIGNTPAATVGGADGKVDFVGGYEPVAFAAGDRSALLLGSDGALAYPAAATTLGAGQAWFRLNGLQAVRDVTGYTLDFGDEILSGVFSSGYADWASLHGLGAWDAADARGIHNVFRYAFNVPTGDFALLGIAFNDDGKAVILTPPLVNTSGFTFSVVVSDNVNGTGNSATYDLQPTGETVINETGKSRRFFRLRAVER